MFMTILIPGCCLYKNREREIRGDLQQHFKLLVNRADSGGTDLSQDGKSLVYVTFDPDESNSCICILNIASGKEDQIVLSAIWPKWSPDKSKIAFYRVDSLYNWKLLYLDVKSRKLHEIDVKGLTGYRILNWSPEGDKIVLTIGHEYAGKLVIVDLTGRILREISKSNIQGLSDPCWSPDGKKIAFSGMEPLEWHDHGANPYGLQRIWVTDLSSGSSNKLTSANILERVIHHSTLRDEVPRWSPNGKWIAYLRTNEGAAAGSIYIVSSDGKSNYEVVSDECRQPLSWTPDSKGIVFTGKHNGQSGIWLVRFQLD
jgi:Tol biopolymer transport system component